MAIPPNSTNNSLKGNAKFPKTEYVGVSNINKDILNSTSPGDVDWEIDDYHLQRLKELGLEDDNDDYDIVARK